MEFLLGNATSVGSASGLINIKLPGQSNIIKSAVSTKLHMNVNTALSTLKLDNIW